MGVEWWLLLSGLLVVASSAFAWGRGKRKLPERLDEPTREGESHRGPRTPSPPNWPYEQEKVDPLRDLRADAAQGWAWVLRKNNALLTRAVLRSMLGSDRPELLELAVEHIALRGHEDAVELLGEAALLRGEAMVAEAFLDQLAEEDMGYAACLLGLFDALTRAVPGHSAELEAKLEARARKLGANNWVEANTPTRMESGVCDRNAQARSALIAAIEGRSTEPVCDLAPEALLNEVWGERLERLDTPGRAGLAAALRALLSPEPLEPRLEALAKDEWVGAFLWRLVWVATGSLKANLRTVLIALSGSHRPRVEALLSGSEGAQVDLPKALPSSSSATIKPGSFLASTVALAARFRLSSILAEPEWTALKKSERSDPDWLVPFLAPAPSSAMWLRWELGFGPSCDLVRGKLLEAAWWVHAMPCESRSGAKQMRAATTGVFYQESGAGLWGASLLFATPEAIDRWLTAGRKETRVMAQMRGDIVKAIPRASGSRARSLLAAICTDELSGMTAELLEIYDEREPPAARALLGMQLLAGRNQEVVEGVLQRLEGAEPQTAIHMYFGACLVAARLENPGRLPLLYAHLDEACPQGHAQLALLERMPRGPALVAMLEVMRRPFQGALSAVSALMKERKSSKAVRSAAGEAKRRMSEALERGSLSMVQEEAQGALSQMEAGALSEPEAARKLSQEPSDP